MSSGFVSGGTTEKPIERDDEWVQAQKEIEANRRRKEEESRQQDGKTLYEVLQNNKAAKQEAFEESIKLKNQFRNLDEDEVEFLDSVLESTRAKEDAVRKETTEQLDLFKRQQEEADKALREENDGKEVDEAGSPTTGESQWAVAGRKRKRAKEKECLKGVKLRKSSSTQESGTPVANKKEDKGDTSPVRRTAALADAGERQEIVNGTKTIESPSSAAIATTKASPTPADGSPSRPKPLPGLGLAGYSSDEDD